MHQLHSLSVCQLSVNRISGESIRPPVIRSYSRQILQHIIQPADFVMRFFIGGTALFAEQSVRDWFERFYDFFSGHVLSHVIERTGHDDLFFRIAVPKVQIHQQFYLRKIYRTVVGNSGSEADEVIRTDDRVCLENRFFLPHPFYFLIIVGNLALGYNAVRALHFDKAFPVYNPDRVFVVAIALENIKLVRLFLQADIRNLRPEILLRELLRFRIIAFLQKICGFNLRGAGGNCSDLTFLGVDFNMYFNCIR